MLYSHNDNKSGNIIKHNLRTSMNEQTHFFIKIHLSQRVNVSLVGERWVERHILRERIPSSHIFFWEVGGPNACNHLQAKAPLIGCVSLARHWFSALCLNLPAWFSSSGLLLITHLLYKTALIVLSSSLNKSKCDSLLKHTGSLGMNQKSMLYVI